MAEKVHPAAEEAGELASMRASAALAAVLPTICRDNNFPGRTAGTVNAGRDYFVPFPVLGLIPEPTFSRHRHIGKQGIALKQIACFTKLRLAVDPFRGRIEGFVPRRIRPQSGVTRPAMDFNPMLFPQPEGPRYPGSLLYALASVPAYNRAVFLYVNSQRHVIFLLCLISHFVFPARLISKRSEANANTIRIPA